jgi:long-chain acyl-CoA synthetase
VDFANLTAGFVTVPIYDTLTPEKAAHILNDSGTKVLFVQDAEMLRRLDEVRRGLKVQLIVVLHGEAPASKGVAVYSEFVAKGREWGRSNPEALDAAAQAIKPKDLASLVYTSGTTGDPKGVMLTHGNFASNATTALGLVEIGPYDTFLSFLPLSHVFERTAGHFAAYAAGSKIVFARSIDTLADDMGRARPTLILSVPRLYEKMYAKVLDKVNSDMWLKRRIFHWAMGVGRQAVQLRQEGRPIPPKLQRKLDRAQKLVFGKLQARVGGRLRYFVSGGAALSPQIEEFFWSAGITILQGYGLTETSPVTNVNLPDAFRIGSVGRTIPGVEVRIDTSEWESSKDPPEGEICFKGPNVMQGYWDNGKPNRESFDKQGWFHTGDVGYVDADGFLWITDRKKEIIVLSNGKKVAPQPIENALQLQAHIAQAMLVGDAHNYVTALIVPDWIAVEKFAKSNGLGGLSHEELTRDPRLLHLIESEVESVNARLSRFEQVKKFWIVPAEWTTATGELTPTMKLRRRVIQDRYADLIEKLYPPGAQD